VQNTVQQKTPAFKWHLSLLKTRNSPASGPVNNLKYNGQVFSEANKERKEVGKEQRRNEVDTCHLILEPILTLASLANLVGNPTVFGCNDDMCQPA
jgi:hypothetical protein